MPRTENRLDRASVLVTAIAFGVVAAFAPAFRAEPVPPPPPPAAPAVVTPAVRPEVLTHVAGTEAGAQPVVALTFDDGPDPTWTPQVLEVLHRHGVVATFCVIGKNAAAHPELVRQVVAAGMRLCDHSRSHDEELFTATEKAMTPEVVGAQQDLAATAQAPVGYFRAPGGNWSPALLQMAAGAGMQPLGWSVDPRDWTRPGITSVIAAVQHQVKPGAVILMHDGGGRRDQTVAALEQLLPWLAGQGYKVTFPN